MTDTDKSLKTRLDNLENELKSLKKIGLIFGSSIQIDRLLALVVEEVCELIQADRGSLFLVDHEKNKLWSKVALKSEIATIEVPIGKGIAGHVAASGEVINIPDAYQDSRFNPEIDKQTGYHTKSILCAPLRKPRLGAEDKTEIIGVIQLLNKKGGDCFSGEDEELLLSFGGNIAASLNNAKLYHELQIKYQEVEILYATEHLISSTYDLDSLLDELLSQFLKYPHVNAGGVIFQENGNFRTFWKILFDKSTPMISQNMLILPTGMPFKLNNTKTVDFSTDRIDSELSSYYSDLGIKPEKIIFIPLQSGDKFLGNLQLVSCDKESNFSVLERIWEILSSQIARAYELFEMRMDIIKNERLSLLGNMMSLIIHDLRSPLNNVVGFVDLMSDEDTSLQERKEYKSIVNKEVQIMINMTREILDFAKGKSSILPGKVGVSELCKSFVEKIQMEMDRNKIKFEYQDFPRGKLWADRERLLRAFINLAKNAIEAMVNQTKPPTFTLRIDTSGSDFIFYLKDNGPGIPESIRNNLFSEYVTSGKEGGTGLGLAIVKKIIEEHKGTITFNTVTGEGTEFVVVLPSFEKVHGQ